MFKKFILIKYKAFCDYFYVNIFVFHVLSQSYITLLSSFYCWIYKKSNRTENCFGTVGLKYIGSNKFLMTHLNIITI